MSTAANSNYVDTNSDWKNSHPLPKRLASPGIPGAQLRTPLKPFNTIVLSWSESSQTITARFYIPFQKCQFMMVEVEPAVSELSKLQTLIASVPTKGRNVMKDLRWCI